jgi:hypothetical protein
MKIKHISEEDLSSLEKKHKCCKCEDVATWFYSPMNGTDYYDNKSRYWCDLHISRGCSCQINPETGIENTDDFGNLLPCCEYDYWEDGFPIER